MHTVSFDWFLSGLEWILNLEFCLLKLLIFYQKLLWNIRSRLNSSTFWVFEPVFTLGWATWNLSLAFKFDDTRLSYWHNWHKNKIGRIDFFLLLPDFSALLAVSAKLSKPTGQKISKVRKQQKKNFNSANLIMSIGKSGIIKFEFQELRFHSVRPNKKAQDSLSI